MGAAGRATRFFFDRRLSFDLHRTPDYLFAVGSALLWALSAKVVGTALAKIPGARKWPSIIPGLLLSLIVGCVALWLLARGNVSFAAFSPWAAAAGVLLFPIGTGLYYLCGHAFDGRVEFASQFANVKPLFSVGFAIVLLGEALSVPSFIALAFIAAGVAVLWHAVRRGTFSMPSLLLGLLLAIAWGGGEALAKLGVTAGPSVKATFWALASGTLLAACFAVPAAIRMRKHAFAGFRTWAPFFALHGLLSFALAYALLFESIRRIGVGQTALINAFWPGVAMLLATQKEERTPPAMKIAALLLLAGSLIAIVAVLAL